MEQDALTLATAFFEACASRDVPTVEALLDDDCVYWIGELSASDPGRDYSKQEFLEILRGSFETLPKGGVRFTFSETVSNGRQAFLDGKGYAETASGAAYRNRYIFFVEVTDGRIARLKEYWDASTLRHLDDR